MLILISQKIDNLSLQLEEKNKKKNKMENINQNPIKERVITRIKIICSSKPDLNYYLIFDSLRVGHILKLREPIEIKFNKYLTKFPGPESQSIIAKDDVRRTPIVWGENPEFIYLYCLCPEEGDEKQLHLLAFNQLEKTNDPYPSETDLWAAQQSAREQLIEIFLKECCTYNPTEKDYFITTENLKKNVY